MAFVKVEKSTRSLAGNSETAVTMGAYLADGKVHKSKTVGFRFTGALITELGWRIDEAKIGVAVHEGTGSDKGFLQLVQDETGYRGSQGSATQGVGITVTVERFRHYVLNDCPVPSMRVNHVIDGATLIIECPDWFRFNPQSEPAPEPAPPPPVKVQVLHPGRGHRRQRA